MFDWVISDTHFFHKNIVQYAGRPANHNELMIENWRKTVPDFDRDRYYQKVLHLGDVLMGQQQLWGTIGWLPGTVSVLNSGNHDEPHKVKWIQENLGWQFIPEFDMQYRGWMIYFSHRPLWVDYPNPNDNTEVVVNREGLKHPGNHSINVHGHIHEKLAPSRYHINVSVEQIGYKPVRLKEILDNKIGELENG
jgi:calcineurin-like phosphoesterase family protein